MRSEGQTRLSARTESEIALRVKGESDTILPHVERVPMSLAVGIRVPRRGNAFSRWVGRAALRLIGWRHAGAIANEPKLVMIGAPHTTNFDGLIAILSLMALGLDARIMVKLSAFSGPLGAVLAWAGAVPIDRTSPKGVIEQTVEMMAGRERMLLVLAPEGTRGAAPDWKRGFYHIAHWRKGSGGRGRLQLSNQGGHVRPADLAHRRLPERPAAHSPIGARAWLSAPSGAPLTAVVRIRRSNVAAGAEGRARFAAVAAGFVAKRLAGGSFRCQARRGTSDYSGGPPWFRRSTIGNHVPPAPEGKQEETAAHAEGEEGDQAAEEAHGRRRALHQDLSDGAAAMRRRFAAEDGPRPPPPGRRSATRVAADTRGVRRHGAPGCSAVPSSARATSIRAFAQDAGVSPGTGRTVA